jgi:xanthine dehydrogenase accessory factor
VSPSDLIERAAALRRAGTPFVLATVVRSVKPASARPGDRALLTQDGAMHGWAGGGCVHTTLQREAACAFADGQPRLVRLSPTPLPEDGIIAYPMTCHSGGTLDIFLEAVLPLPLLIVLGESPVAAALGQLGPTLGFDTATSLPNAVATDDAWVVAAGMTSGEDHPLVREALLTGAPYVAMVSSRRRADAFLAELRGEGLAEETLERLKAPAGLDIGATTPAEIALSILAEIVQRRRARVNVVQPVHSQLAIDPICEMEVDIATARWTAERDGHTYYFCAPGCRKAFLKAP